MQDRKVVFIGTTDFSCAVLDTLVQEGYQLLAAVSQPDRPSGRKKIIRPTPVHQYCLDHAIPCLQPEKLRKESEAVLAYQPDLIITCAYGQIVPQDILAAPRYGCLNIHPSLLPKYRGGAPIQHAIWHGDTETGVCLMEMVKAMDAGRVYACIRTPIGPDETTEELTPRLMEISRELIRTALPEYLAGRLPGTVQEESQVVLAPNISREDEQIRFASESLPELYNHIRALIDWPGCYGILQGRRIKFHQVRMRQAESGAQPGTILGFSEGAMEVACAGGVLRVLQLQMEGRQRMSAGDFENGAGRQLIGQRFE